LSHPRSTPWPFVADDDDIARTNVTVQDGFERRLLPVEDPRGAVVGEPSNGRRLDHRAGRRHVSSEDRKGPGRADGVVQGPHDVSRNLRRDAPQRLRYRVPGHRHRVAVNLAGVEEALQDDGHAADSVQIGYDVRAA